MYTLYSIPNTQHAISNIQYPLGRADRTRNTPRRRSVTYLGNQYNTFCYHCGIVVTLWPVVSSLAYKPACWTVLGIILVIPLYRHCISFPFPPSPLTAPYLLFSSGPPPTHPSDASPTLPTRLRIGLLYGWAAHCRRRTGAPFCVPLSHEPHSSSWFHQEKEKQWGSRQQP